MTRSPGLTIEIPAPVREILEKLKRGGYEACIVGGCVRDALLGRKPEDWDITTSALPYEVKSLFHNTVDTGIQHGTVMVILHGEGYEVTTYRVDGEYLDSRHPSTVTFTRSLEEDLKRRDFTINAFAWDENGLIDLFDGLTDLREKVIRCVGDPKERFREDALRIMRAIRFSAQLGFSIEPETGRMISAYAQKLADISKERIRVEWEKTLLSPNPCTVNAYAEYGLAPYILPSCYAKCFDPGKEPVLEEICRRHPAAQWLSHPGPAGRRDTESQLISHPGSAGNRDEEPQWISHPGRSERLIAAYAVEGNGNTCSRKTAEGREDQSELYRRLMMTAFFENLTPEEANQAFRELKYDNVTRKAVTEILRYKDEEIPPDRREVKRALNRMGQETLEAVLAFREARLAAGGNIFRAAEDGGKSDRTEARDREAAWRGLHKLQTILDEVLRSGEPWNLSQLAVNGSDLIAAGVESGEKVGKFLKIVLQKVIESPTLNNREILCSEDFLSEVENEFRRSV